MPKNNLDNDHLTLEDIGHLSPEEMKTLIRQKEDKAIRELMKYSCCTAQVLEDPYSTCSEDELKGPA
jgi:hypothetical protein